MGFDKKSWYNWCLIFIIILCVTLIIFQNVDAITGNTVSGSSQSNVTITTYFSVSLSTNLSNGIDFGIINGTNFLDINASDNNNTGANQTSLWINVSTDSNSAADFCVGANATLKSGTDIIGITNESYSNSTTNSDVLPNLTEQVSLIVSASGVKAGESIAIGGVNYYRFWLDIPSQQASGTYTNNITFKGVSAGVAC